MNNESMRSKQIWRLKEVDRKKKLREGTEEDDGRLKDEDDVCGNC
jgi:hypothetical protein